MPTSRGRSQRVIAEVEGQVRHASPRERQRDAQRRNELQHDGWIVLTFTYEDVTRRPAWVAAQVASSAHRPPPRLMSIPMMRQGIRSPRADSLTHIK